MIELKVVSDSYYIGSGIVVIKGNIHELVTKYNATVYFSSYKTKCGYKNSLCIREFTNTYSHLIDFVAPHKFTVIFNNKSDSTKFKLELEV